jgi:hypothetical protein
MPSEPAQPPAKTPAHSTPGGEAATVATTPAHLTPGGDATVATTPAHPTPGGDATVATTPAHMTPSGQAVAGTPAPGSVPVLHGPWPQPSVWGRWWPGPSRPASAPTVVAVLVAAVIAALSIPLDRPGVGWLVAVVAGTAALVVARAIPYRPPANVPPPLVWRSGPTLSPARFGWSAITVALLGAGTIRAAGWLFLLCLATAMLTGALAVAGGRSLRAMTVAVAITPIAAFRAVPWVMRGLAGIRRPGSGHGSGARVAATAAVSVALLTVFGSLFASADAAFAGVVRHALPDVDGVTLARWGFVFALASAALGGAAYLRAAPPDLTGLDGPGRRRVTRLEWAIPLSLLVLLFALFVGVQLTVLFGGSRHVLETEGLTYADYARSGFWQLLAVTALTLGVLAGAARWAPRGTRTDRILIRALLGALAVLTLVIVASALHRMDLYADTYGLTRLRVLVALCEFWLGVVFAMVLVAGIRLRASWLPRAVVVAGVLALLGLAAANPDGLIADRNITRYEKIGRIDTAYLSGLSADAVPALERLTGDQRDCALGPIAGVLDRNPDDWRGWNYGREHAREILAAQPQRQPRDC